MVDRSTSRLRLVSGTVVLALVVALSALALPHPAAAADFPRISSIWPASATPDSLLAKHEYVVLGRYEKSRIPKIRALNPDVLLLTTDNAIEIAHEQIASYPTQWLLTQVGSTLTSAVNSTTKVLPVAATTASGKTLFIPGDLVVIGNEVATVESVAANSITVKRGAWRPAESHAAGARVAATLTYWLGTVTMDMSTFCPKVTVDAAVGPETYAENKARTSAARVFDAAWDGIYVDRTDGNQSYLVTATFTPDENRTIDPNRSNKIVTDGYSSFDSAWNAGLRVYLTGLRTRIGGSRVILGNGAWPYYDLLNGTVFERFPNASGGIAGIGWRDAVFTRDVPWSVATGKGSYTQWSTEARQPNLTTVGTYQNDNGGADGKTPDYRNMRFALTTALMGDGCLTYWYSHDDNTVLWFDEYDAAGRGTGYLGEPLGAAHPAHSALQTPDLLGGDGAFDTTAQLNPWKVVTSTGYAATKALDTAQKSGGTGSAKITVTQTPSTGAETWRANIQHTIAIEKDKPYTLTFRARADRPLALTAYIERLAGSSVAHTSFGTVNLTTEWQTFELPATPAGSDPAAKLILGFGGQPGTLWLDEMMLRAGNQRDVMRRDFEGGIALVNATNLPSTVDLGGSFRKIKGTQVPAVNNGALVTSVTLPPMDGIVLLRDDSDVTPPTTPTGVVASALDTTSVLALWSASVDANGVAGYRVYVNGTLATTVTGTSATLKNLTPGTTYTISVCAFDKTGNLSQPSIPASVTTPQSQDTTGPTVGGLLCLTHASPDVWYSNSGPVTFSWSQSVDPSGVVGYSTSWSTNPLTVPDNTADVVGGSLSTKSFAAPVADGVWYFKVKALDGAGNWGPVTGREVRIDTTKPTGSIILNGGLTYTSATRVSVTSNVAFGASGASQMRFDAGSGFGPWQPYAAQSQVTVTPGDGRKTVKAEFKSASGVISGPGTIAATVVLSTSVPSGSISIANGSTYTTVAGVTVASNMSFGVSGPHPTQAMRFSVNGSEWSEWKPYAATHQLTLPGADGLKTVSAQFKDAAGALSSTDAVQDSIVLDTVVPAIITLASPPPPQNRSPLTPRSAQFTWDVRVGPSEVAGYSYAFNKNTPLPPDESVDTLENTASLAVSDGEWWFSVRAKNGAGVWGPATNMRVVVSPESTMRTLMIRPDDAGVTFDRFVMEPSESAASGMYLYGRWADTHLTVRFSGNAIRWIGPRLPNYGMASVSVDGQSAGIADAYAARGSLNQMIHEVHGLADGPHTLEVHVTGTKNRASRGSMVAFDRFEVDTANPQSATTRIHALANMFTGPWTVENNPLYVNGTYHRSASSSASFTMSFVGTQVAWVGPRGADCGRARIWIDGVDQGTVSQFGSGTVWRERIWESGPLPQGAHTITIKPAGTKDIAATGTYVVIDAMDIVQ